LYKLIAIDIDDTLLNDRLEVTPGTREAIARAMARGVFVTLATGRMYASARQIAQQLGLNVPLITYQGALVKNLLDEKIWYERYVPLEAAEAVYRFARERGLHLQAYCDDRLYAQEENEKLLAYSRNSNVPYFIEPDFRELLKKPMAKMMIIDEPRLLDRLIPQLQPVIGGEARLTKSKPNYLEITHIEGTKGQALRHLAAEIGCPMEQTIAIGDSWNDRDMLETAGLGVAMGNAVPSLKEIADYVTLDNNEEGVRHVIETRVLNP
jgi:hypothetical protein